MARIYVVEDEALISTMLQINLRRAGHDVTCFGTAEGMLEQLGQAPCDILLLDIMLPGINGDEALALLRKEGHKMPVVMLTARQDVGTKVGTLQSGADDYVTKPFDLTELLARIDALLRRQQTDR
jgi:DNA-binding response OmpR family regulator